MAGHGSRNSGLGDRVRAIVDGPGVSEKKMFGGICFMLNGNMFAGASARGLLVRVGREGNAAALARPHTRPMDRGGRPLAGYVRVAEAGLASEKALREWLDIARAHVATLPGKEGKPSSRSRPRR